MKSIEKFVFPGNKLTKIIIPNSVTSIGRSAFSFTQLTVVVIPVRSIGEEAFYGNQLTEVVIPNSVRSIGEDAFGGNYKLKKIVCRKGSYAEKYVRLNQLWELLEYI